PFLHAPRWCPKTSGAVHGAPTVILAEDVSAAPSESRRSRARSAGAQSPGIMDLSLDHVVSPSMAMGFVLHRDRLGALRRAARGRRVAGVVPRAVGEWNVAA